MQKKLIALAVAALASSSAFAQVTVAGVADAGYFSTKTTEGTSGTTNKKSGIDSGHLSGSRLIVKADEDLGNGLSAGAYYEVAVDLADSSASFFGISRQSFVSLKSTSVGEFRLGRQYSAGSATVAMFDPFAGSPTLSVQADIAGDIGSDLAAGGTRHNSTLGYIAPKFGGVQIAASYSFGEQSTHAGAEAAKTLSLSGTFATGPVAVGLMYTARNDNGGTAVGATANDITDIGIGASYDLGVVKLFATFQTLENDGITATTSRESDEISVGALIPVGSGNIHLGYAQAETDSDTSGVTTDKSKDTGYSIAYTHALSKRTTAYVGYTSREREDDLTPFAAALPKEITSYAIGLRHSF